MLYDAICSKCGLTEIDKRMSDPFPKHHTCGGNLKRHFTPTPVIYASAGFFSTDVNRMKSLIGSERYAQFEKQRDAAQARARAGTLTPYEKAMEVVDANG